MQLLFADVRPHIVNTDIEVWVAGKAHPDDVKERGQSLVGNLKVNMFQMDDIADVFVCIFHHPNPIVCHRHDDVMSSSFWGVTCVHRKVQSLAASALLRIQSLSVFSSSSLWAWCIFAWSQPNSTTSSKAPEIASVQPW